MEPAEGSPACAPSVIAFDANLSRGPTADELTVVHAVLARLRTNVAPED